MDGADANVAVASCEELDPILALGKSFGFVDNNHVHVENLYLNFANPESSVAIL